MKLFRQIVVLGLLGIPFGILGRAFYLDGYYFENAPRAQEPVRGAVVPVNVHHGTTVFLTREEWRFFGSPTADTVQTCVFTVAAFAAFFLNQKWRVLGKRQDAA
jgi:hypothetical protein